MTIDKGSWYYRTWAWTYEDSWRVPEHTTLCAMFWRTAMVGLALLCVGLLAVAALGGLAWKAWLHPILAAKVAGGVLAVVSLLAGLAFLSIRWDERAPGELPRLEALRDAIGDSVPVALLRAWKDKVCPLVTFTDTRPDSSRGQST